MHPSHIKLIRNWRYKLRVLLPLVVLMLSGCMSPIRLGISETEWQSYSPEEQQKIKGGYYEILKSRMADDEKVVPDGSRVTVRIAGGKVAMPPFTHLTDYTPVEFEIVNGDSQRVKIHSVEDDKTIVMKAYYRNKTLYIDPSHYDPSKRLGSIQLHYSPIWDRGFTYQNVSSNGYAHLSNVNVTVKKDES